LAHITGGGLPENLPRVLPEGTAARIDASAWSAPPVFRWLKQAGNIATSEMYRTFNSGIGMVCVVNSARADELSKIMSEHGETVHVIGEITERTKDMSPVDIDNPEAPFEG